MRHPIRILAATLLALAPLAASAQAPADIRAALETEARRATPGFSGFSAERGGQFFAAKHGGNWSCATCHTPDPLATGHHASTGKGIAPLAPAANPQRFTDAAKVEKWFRRNCNDVLARECSPAEKGDIVAYLLALKK